MTDPTSPSLVALERDALQALVDGDPIDSVLRDVARAVGQLQALPGVAFLRLDESGASLSLLAQSGLRGAMLDALGTIRVGPAGQPPGVAVFTSAPAAGPLVGPAGGPGAALAEPLTDDDGRIAGALLLAGLSRPEEMPEPLRRTIGRLFAMALRRDRRDREVQDLIYRDPLTGLPNRRCFDERLAETFARGVDAACPVSVLFMDLDEFKKVNDTLGHEVGDLLLAIVGSRLRRALSTE
ncbi:GGDEF domain-containing protein, partial [Inquilinus limosus]